MAVLFKKLIEAAKDGKEYFPAPEELSGCLKSSKARRDFLRNLRGLDNDPDAQRAVIDNLIEIGARLAVHGERMAADADITLKSGYGLLTASAGLAALGTETVGGALLATIGAGAGFAGLVICVPAVAGVVAFCVHRNMKMRHIEIDKGDIPRFGTLVKEASDIVERRN